MKFTETSLQGACILEGHRTGGDGGTPAEPVPAAALEERGLVGRMVSVRVQGLPRRHQLLGLHWQTGRASQALLLECLRGQVLTVIVDLRRGSPTFGRHEKVVLSEDDARLLYVPRGLAHGLLALMSGTRVRCRASHEDAPKALRGIRWNDPSLGIAWPVNRPLVSEQDQAWPDLRPAAVHAARG